MAVMAQARGIFYSPGRLFRFMGFTSSVVNGLERPRRRRSVKRSEPLYNFEQWRSDARQGASAADEAVRYISSGRLW